MTKKQERQQSAFERLALQIKSGVKPDKENPLLMVELSDKDRVRINREIGILKSKTGIL